MTNKEEQAIKFLSAVRGRVRDLKLNLRSMDFISGTPRKVTCCALGAALALKVKTKKELLTMSMKYFSDNQGLERHEFVAKVLNGGTDPQDMFQLECGFENWRFNVT